VISSSSDTEPEPELTEQEKEEKKKKEKEQNRKHLAQKKEVLRRGKEGDKAARKAAMEALQAKLSKPRTRDQQESEEEEIIPPSQTEIPKEGSRAFRARAREENRVRQELSKSRSTSAPAPGKQGSSKASKVSSRSSNLRKPEKDKVTEKVKEKEIESDYGAIFRTGYKIPKIPKKQPPKDPKDKDSGGANKPSTSSKK
jgi:hypothetical protein